jgi:capsular exopolysaccharide synthesis family protein
VASAPQPKVQQAGPAVLRYASTEDSKLVTAGAPVAVIEQYRALAASLHEAQADRKVKTVMVTSAVPGEGKTLTLINLALTLSESYKRRVLLIDADLRSPSLHRRFGVTNDVGLVDSLRPPRSNLPLVTVLPNLMLLPAGRPEPDPPSVLSSEHLSGLIEECASCFDWVLLDTPPVAFLADAQLLVRHTNAVLFVIAAGSTPFPIVEQAIADVGREHVIGTVLNRVDPAVIRSLDYYYYDQR